MRLSQACLWSGARSSFKLRCQPSIQLCGVRAHGPDKDRCAILHRTNFNLSAGIVASDPEGIVTLRSPVRAKSRTDLFLDRVARTPHS